MFQFETGMKKRPCRGGSSEHDVPGSVSGCFVPPDALIKLAGISQTTPTAVMNRPVDYGMGAMPDGECGWMA